MPKRSKKYQDRMARVFEGPEEASKQLWEVLVPDANQSLEGKFAWDDETVLANASIESPINFDVTLPQDITVGGEEMLSAPTKKPSRPRALSIGYNPNSKTVYIVFRDNTWWQYNDVSTEVWLGLKNSGSTNEYLPTLEGACSSHHKAVVEDMSSASKEKLSYTASIAASIQNTPMLRAVKAFREQEGLPDISQ